MLVTKEFTFDSAHFLPSYKGKCESMHGHTYRLQVTVEGQLDSEGMVMDFLALKQMVKKYVIEKLDHKLINDVIDVPSAENMSIWTWNQLKDAPELPEGVKLYEVKIWETKNSFATYYGK